MGPKRSLAGDSSLVRLFAEPRWTSSSESSYMTSFSNAFPGLMFEIREAFFKICFFKLCVSFLDSCSRLALSASVSLKGVYKFVSGRPPTALKWPE